MSTTNKRFWLYLTGLSKSDFFQSSCLPSSLLLFFIATFSHCARLGFMDSQLVADSNQSLSILIYPFICYNMSGLRIQSHLGLDPHSCLGRCNRTEVATLTQMADIYLQLSNVPRGGGGWGGWRQIKQTVFDDVMIFVSGQKPTPLLLPSHSKGGQHPDPNWCFSK